MDLRQIGNGNYAVTPRKGQVGVVVEERKTVPKDSFRVKLQDPPWDEWADDPAVLQALVGIVQQSTPDILLLQQEPSTDSASLQFAGRLREFGKNNLGIHAVVLVVKKPKQPQVLRFVDGKAISSPAPYSKRWCEAAHDLLGAAMPAITAKHPKALVFLVARHSPNDLNGMVAQLTPEAARHLGIANPEQWEAFFREMSLGNSGDTWQGEIDRFISALQQPFPSSAIRETQYSKQIQETVREAFQTIQTLRKEATCNPKIAQFIHSPAFYQVGHRYHLMLHALGLEQWTEVLRLSRAMDAHVVEYRSLMADRARLIAEFEVQRAAFRDLQRRWGDLPKPREIVLAELEIKNFDSRLLNQADNHGLAGQVYQLRQLLGTVNILLRQQGK